MDQALPTRRAICVSILQRQYRLITQQLERERLTGVNQGREQPDEKLSDYHKTDLEEHLIKLLEIY